MSKPVTSRVPPAFDSSIAGKPETKSHKTFRVLSVNGFGARVEIGSGLGEETANRLYWAAGGGTDGTLILIEPE